MSKRSKLQIVLGITVALLVGVFSVALYCFVRDHKRVEIDTEIEINARITQEKFFTEELHASKAVDPTTGKVEFHFGYTPNDTESKKFTESLAKPNFSAAGPEALRKLDETKPVFLYRALYEAWRIDHNSDWVVGKQGIGDCVSWGWMHGSAILGAIQFKLGDTSEWHEPATEAIYGGSRVEGRYGDDQRYRGGYQDGSYGAAAGKWVNNFGIIFRQKYPELGIDLTSYDPQRAKEWGNYGCGGRDDNGQLDNIAREHPIKGVTVVRTFTEAAAAIQSGYPVPVCSNVGFTMQRDQDGFTPQGSKPWGHCMCFVGVRFVPRPGLLCLNSWGPTWISGPKYPDDQPDGSFWVESKTVDRMLDGNDSFAISAYKGFEYRNIKWGDFVEDRPAKVQEFLARIRNEKNRADHFVLAP